MKKKLLKLGIGILGITIIVIGIIFIGPTDSIRASGFNFNGGAGATAATGGNGCSTTTNTWCRFGMNGGLGVRASFVYCQGNGNCRLANSGSGEASRPVIDIWHRDIRTISSSFYSGAPVSIAVRFVSGWHNMVPVYVIGGGLPSLTVAGPPYFRDVNIWSNADVNTLLGQMGVNVQALGIEDEDIHKPSLHPDCISGGGNCHGYRIFVEPIFLIGTRTGGVYRFMTLTPTEGARLGFADGGMFTNSALSMHTVRPDVGTATGAGGSAADLMSNVGVALNIIDPWGDELTPDYPPPPEEPPDPCDPIVVDPGQLDCHSNNRQLRYQDPTDWDACVIGQPEYRDDNLGNRFCPVYCREEFQTNFAGNRDVNPRPVRAGGHFTWARHRMSGMRECRMVDRFDLFLSSLSTANAAVRTAFSNTLTASPEEYDAARAAYRSAIRSRDGLFTMIDNCAAPRRRELFYCLEPDLYIHYISPAGGTYSAIEPLIRSVPPGEGEVISNLNTACPRQNVNQAVCSGSSCTNQRREVQRCTGVEMSSRINLTFNLREDFYRFVNKETAKSYLRETEIPNNVNVIDIGYPNFPIPFNSEIGNYGDRHGRGRLNLYLGATCRTRLDEILGINNNPREYRCEYSVEKGPFCPIEECPPPPNAGGSSGGGGSDRGVDVIYRVIDLNNPFPDITGAGRRPGDNWAESIAPITNNRNVQTDEVFNLEPMFRFILNPRTIREIRRENRQTNYAIHSWSAFGRSFDFTCTVPGIEYSGLNTRSSGGTRCTSGYVTSLIERMHHAGHFDTGICGIGSEEIRRDIFDICRFEN